MQRFNAYLGHIDQLTQESTDGKSTYIHPTLKNLGVVNLVLVREAIAPVVFRNAEQEITDIDIGGEAYVRAVPNKFKYPEKGRGLQLLRAYQVGGRLPQNKTFLTEKQRVSEAFDLNTLVFGDSTTQGNRVLPVKAAVGYSDGLSLKPRYQCVDDTFHNRAMEDGTLFDAADKKNSDNLFSRHFIKPGTLLVQVLSTRGRVLPREGLDHLLLCLGLAGAYGGQTSVTGVNIRTHLVGLYASRFERPSTSPYELVQYLGQQAGLNLDAVTEVSTALHTHLAAEHETHLPGTEAQAYLNGLVEQFETDATGLKTQYQRMAPKVAALFDNWFGSSTPTKKGGKKTDEDGE